MSEIENNSEFQTISKGLDMHKMEEKIGNSTSISEKEALRSSSKALRNELTGDRNRHNQDIASETAKKARLEKQLEQRPDRGATSDHTSGSSSDRGGSVSIGSDTPPEKPQKPNVSISNEDDSK